MALDALDGQIIPCQAQQAAQRKRCQARGKAGERDLEKRCAGGCSDCDGQQICGQAPDEIETGESVMAADPHWIEHMHMKKGAFKKKAKAAGVSTSALAKRKKGAGGKIGKQANLALTLGKLRRVKG